MTGSPRLAVIIPVFNGAHELGACLTAIRQGTVTPSELVVVDNASTDDTAAVARAGGATVVTEPMRGSYHARNAGIAATSADILAFTDADCVPEPDWLEQLAKAFDDPTVDVAGGEIVPITVATPAQRWAVARGVLVQARAFSNEYLPYFATANVAWRRRVLEAIGGFDAELFSGGDVDACWRAQTLVGAKLVLVPEARVGHRHRARIRRLVRVERRYGEGHGRLDRRWSADPRYRATTGSRAARLRAVWLLPARLPYRLIRRDEPWVPVIDAAVRLAREVGRTQGRRQPPLPARPGAPEPPESALR